MVPALRIPCGSDFSPTPTSDVFPPASSCLKWSTPSNCLGAVPPWRAGLRMAKKATLPRKPTVRVTATEAKNRFGSLSTQAKREPIFVEKAGRLDTVILSAEHYHALQARQDKASRATRKRRFEAEFGDWIAAQNASFEAHGIPGADLRPW
jgi:hypothetical protein